MTKGFSSFALIFGANCTNLSSMTKKSSIDIGTMTPKHEDVA